MFFSGTIDIHVSVYSHVVVYTKMSAIFLILPCSIIIEEMLSLIEGYLIVTSLKQLNGYFDRYAEVCDKYVISAIVDRYVGGSMNRCFRMFFGQK